MSEREDEIKSEILLYGHILPPADPEFCSECRKALIPKFHNVVRINKAPTKILGLDGKALGVEGQDQVRAYFHAACFQKISDKRKLPGRVECSHCGVLSIAAVMPDGTRVRDFCKCSCHNGKSYCSLILS